MSSSVVANSTDGLGPPFAVDSAGGVYWPYGKIAYGADGTQTLVTATNGLPGNLIQIGGENVPLVNMDYTAGATQNMMPVALAFRGNGGAQYVASNAGLPIDAINTSIGIQDNAGNPYISASATMNLASGAGLFPTVTVAQFDDAAPTAITEGRFGNLRMSSRREMYVQIRDAAGNERGLNIDANGRVGVSSPAATSGGAANVSSSAASVTLLASNASRKGFTIFNDSTQVLYVKFGATASATSFHVKMAAGAFYESMPGVNYTGIIDGIWASANGSARVGEFT